MDQRGTVVDSTRLQTPRTDEQDDCNKIFRHGAGEGWVTSFNLIELSLMRTWLKVETSWE